MSLVGLTGKVFLGLTMKVGQTRRTIIQSKSLKRANGKKGAGGQEKARGV